MKMRWWWQHVRCRFDIRAEDKPSVSSERHGNVARRCRVAVNVERPIIARSGNRCDVHESLFARRERCSKPQGPQDRRRIASLDLEFVERIQHGLKVRYESSVKPDHPREPGCCGRVLADALERQVQESLQRAPR